MAKHRRDDPGPGQAAQEQPPPEPRAGDLRRHGLRLGGASVHGAIANEIGQRIVRGDYPPGAVLPNEQQWSEIFEVSRSAVREAMKMLMAKNLLASRQKVGSRVEPRERWNLLDRDVLGWYAAAPNQLKFLRTVQEFRYIIEPEATALAADRRSDAQMSDITRACSDMRGARFLSERTEADTRFHVAILHASGNELLVPLGVLIESALEHLFGFITSEVNDLTYAQELHEDIERCLRLRRREAARRAVRRLLATTDSIIERAVH